MSGQKKELIMRAESKMDQLKADLSRTKANAKSAQNDGVKSIERKITEWSEVIKEANNNFTESVAEKINSLLK